MQRGIALSSLLHFAIFLIVFFGLPTLWQSKRDLEPAVISVEILPIRAITNVRPSPTPPPPKKEDQPIKTKKPVPKTSQQLEVKELAPKPETVKMPDPKKKEEPKPKEEPKEKQEEDPLAAVLKSVKQMAQETDTEEKKEAEETEDNSKTKSKSDNYNPLLPLSMNEKDAIRNHFMRCWRVPAGAKDAHELAVRVRVLLMQDGTVQEAELAEDQLGRYTSDTFFRAAADSALRAVWKCSPVANLPPEKYETWRDLELNFDPRELLY